MQIPITLEWRTFILSIKDQHSTRAPHDLICLLLVRPHYKHYLSDFLPTSVKYCFNSNNIDVTTNSTCYLHNTHAICLILTK